MRKIIALIMAFAMLLSLCACGGETEAPAEPVPGSEAPAAPGKRDEESDAPAQSIEVDEKLFNVELTIPASFFEDETEEDIKANAEEQGIKKCVINDDGSVTYTMSKDKQAELLEEMKTSAQESFASLLEGEEAVASFVDIQYNDDLSEFNITVNDHYSVWDAFYGFTFYLVGAYYQIFDGADPDTLDVIVNFVDESGEVKDTMSYREFMDNSEATGEESEPAADEEEPEEAASAPAGKTLPEIIPGESITIEDECEFYVDFFQMDSRIDPPKPGSWYSYYEADRDKVFVDICVAYKNLDTHDTPADEVMSGTLVYGGRYEYDGFSIIEEGNRDDFTYSNITSIAPLTTGYVHYLFEVPEEVAESEAALWAELNIGGEKYMLAIRGGDEDLVVGVTDDVRTAEGEVGMGERVAVDGKCSFFIDFCGITDRVDPPRPADYYSYYEAEDGMVYVDLCIGYKNLRNKDIMADEVMEASLTYDEKYEYEGFSVIEEKNRGDLTYSNITSIAPLTTEYVHYLFSVPESVEDDSAPIVIDFSIGGNDYSYTLR